MKNFGFYFLWVWLIITLLGGVATMLCGFIIEATAASKFDPDTIISIELTGVLLLTMSMFALVFPDSWAFKK